MWVDTGARGEFYWMAQSTWIGYHFNATAQTRRTLTKLKRLLADD